jgi:cytochrome c-type biogenesis protein CcmH
MSTFLLVAALMAVIAATAVALPLLRNRQSRLVGAVAGIVVMGAAAGLYPLWSNWDWRATAQQKPEVSPEVLAMVAKLEARMKEDPHDIKGWLILGRSYLALERVDEAVVAFDHAHQLDQNNVEAMLGLGEAMSVRAGGNITPAAMDLFEQAVKLEPDAPRALLYSGFGAATRGDRGTARARWLKLEAMQPPPEVKAMLDQRIAELGTADLSPGPADAGASAAADAAQATINLSLAPALKSRLTGDVPLFLFAREVGGRGPPLAAKRLTSAALGSRIRLSAADSLMPGRALVAGQKVSITARISFSGQPLPSAGDLYGELTYDVGHDGARDLIIDRVAQ